MSHDTTVQPTLSDLLARYVEKQANAQAAGTATFDGEVTPYEVGSVQPLDPQLAWDEALAVLPFYGENGNQHCKAPPHWPQLVAGHESIVAIAFCAGNFPQLMRSFHAILAQPNLLEMRPQPGRPAVADGLLSWAEESLRRHAAGETIVALGALRLARHFGDAENFVSRHDDAIEAAWRAAWENEKAALAWHAGKADEACRTWDSLPPSVPVLFNRGMAALFTGDHAAATQHLTAAASKLPPSSAWHHLARLYLTLAGLRR